VESNGSLLPGGWLKSHLQADCLYTRISSGLTLGNEYRKTLPSYSQYTTTTPTVKRRRILVANEVVGDCGGEVGAVGGGGKSAVGDDQLQPLVPHGRL